MKRVIQYVVLIALLSFLGIILTHKDQYRQVFQRIERNLHIIQKPCAKPIKYAVGNIDPRFGISQADFQKTISEAKKIWENPVNKQLFEYDPNATFKINLVYDERQQRTQESEKLQNKLDTLESSHEQVVSQYKNLNSSLQKRLDNYNKAVADYEKKLNDYNDEVQKWNNQGGAPPDEYDNLKKEKKDLQDTQAQLEKERQAINKLIGQTNDLAQQEENIVDNYNTSLNTYKNKYGQATQFDKGVFDGTKIDIFQFKENSDLRLTLAHEFGHALGIDHLQNPDSIMYYLMGEQDMDNPHLSPEDITALKNVCQIKT